MDTKLTLSMDEKVIQSAKKYARDNHTSLSKMVENFLAMLASKAKSEEEISPLVKSLSGIIKQSKETDYKKQRTQYLEKKYK